MGHSDTIGPLRAATAQTDPGVAARAAYIPGMSMERIVDGKIVESWGVFDTSAMLKLAGAVPQPAEERH